MRTRTAVLPIVLLSAAAVLAIWMLRGSSDEGPAREPAAAADHRPRATRVVAFQAPTAQGWQPGTAYAHQVGLKITVQGGQAPASFELRGTWKTLVVRATDQERDLQVTFTPDQQAGAGASDGRFKGLNQTFVVRYDRRGTAGALLFASPPARGSLDVLRELATTFQLTFPEGNESQWTATELDAAGEVVVGYERAGADRYLRRKLRYSRLATGDGLVVPTASQLQPRILQSEGRYLLDASGRIKAATVRYVTAASISGNGEHLRSDVSTTFHLLSSGAEAVDPAWQAPASVVSLTADADSFAEASRNALKDQVRGATVDQLLGDIKAGRAAKEPQKVATAQARLSALIELDGSAVDAVMAQVRAGKHDAGVFGALGGAGTPAAQAALIATATGGRGTTDDRLAAIHALQAVGTPTAETLAGLEGLTGEEQGALRKDASYSLGTVIGRLGKTDAQAARAGLARLAGEYDRATTAEEKSRILSALGNTDSVDALGTLKRGLQDPELGVRIVAVQSLRGIPAPEVDQILSTLLTSQAEAPLREAALFAAEFRPYPPLAAAIQSVLQVEKDTRFRNRTLELVAKYRRRDGGRAVRPLLEWLAQNDPDEKVRESVRKMLAAGT